MMAIGRYFVFMICVTATMSSPMKGKDSGELLRNDVQKKE